MTQRDPAQRLGCQPATVANIETGQRRVDVIELVALANALGVSPHRLFDSVVENVDSAELINNFSRSRKSARDVKKIARRRHRAGLPTRYPKSWRRQASSFRVPLPSEVHL
nr:helix-turn-helix transcriptional regulator [Paracoccus sp. IB05]